MATHDVPARYAPANGYLTPASAPGLPLDVPLLRNVHILSRHTPEASQRGTSARCRGMGELLALASITLPLEMVSCETPAALAKSRLVSSGLSDF